MCKHRYVATGIASIGGRRFRGECIADNMNTAIFLFENHEDKLSVHSIERKEQVSVERFMGVTDVKYGTRIQN